MAVSFIGGDIFRKLEEIEKDLDIEDYSVSQNTLDNVSFFCQSKHVRYCKFRENHRPVASH
jgi:hypothetical protein